MRRHDGSAPRPDARPPFLRPGFLTLMVTGGMAGSAVRALIEDTFGPGPGDWPWATFAINIAGSFLLGLLVALLASRGPDEGPRRAVRLALGTGVLGGFTTYSTFIVEVDALLRDGHLELGAGYALGSVALGILAAGLGMLLGGGAPSNAVDPDEVGR